jgi:hypothetical protein
MAASVRYNMPGPIDVPQETNSGLDLLPTNRTYIAMPFKGDKAARQPEEIPADSALSTEAVMKYADPHVKVKLKTGDPENAEVADTIRFQGGIDSFSPNAIKKNSPMLRRLDAEFQASEALVDRIDKNAKFRKALDDAGAREAVLAALRSIMAELDASMPVENEE